MGSELDAAVESVVGDGFGTDCWSANPTESLVRGQRLFVDRILTRSWSRGCPFNIAVEAGGCHQTWADVRLPGQVVWWHVSMASQRVDSAGEKIEAW
jgi:hypothetical protein